MLVVGWLVSPMLVTLLLLVCWVAPSSGRLVVPSPTWLTLARWPQGDCSAGGCKGRSCCSRHQCGAVSQLISGSGEGKGGGTPKFFIMIFLLLLITIVIPSSASLCCSSSHHHFHRPSPVLLLLIGIISLRVITIFRIFASSLCTKDSASAAALSSRSFRSHPACLNWGLHVMWK